VSASASSRREASSTSRLSLSAASAAGAVCSSSGRLATVYGKTTAPSMTISGSACDAPVVV